MAEISAAVVHVLFLGVDSAVRSIPDLGRIGSQFMGGDSSAKARRAGGFEGLIRPLFEAGHGQKQVYLSNLLILFALVREIRAIVNGHLMYGAAASDLSPEGRGRLQAFSALDVDGDAFGFVVMNLQRGLPIFEVRTDGFSTRDRLRAFQLGVIEDLMRSREVGLAQASMGRLAFAPKSMPVG